MPPETGTTTTIPTTTIPVRLRCLACHQHTTVLVATRGRLAALTADQQDVLDDFTRSHAATQVVS